MMAKLIGISFVLLIILRQTTRISAAVAHTHSHTQSNKERLKDGANHQHDGNDAHDVEFDHEAIIGNVKEAQEFDSLSPEESKRRLAILVKMMDLNNDQFIDRHELKAWILRSFKKLSEEEAAERFKDVDANNDEVVTWQEYLMDTYSMENENDKKETFDFDNSSEEEQKMIMDDKKMFNAADTNGDGVLNGDEYVLFQNPEEHPEMLPIVLEQTMRDKDTDSDGKINFTEFVGDSAYQHDKQWLITEKERFDKDFDTNQDGFLTGHEVLSWIVPSNEEVANDEVDHLFAATDDDHNDRLSYIEILTNYETFVGSEATDYGDHLTNINRLTDEL